MNLGANPLDQIEAHADARFQTINARFAGIDGRFAAMAERLDAIERHQGSIARRFDTRFETIEHRIDASRRHLDHIAVQASDQIEQARSDLARVVLLALLGTCALTAVLCLVTIVLVI